MKKRMNCLSADINGGDTGGGQDYYFLLCRIAEII